MMNFTQTSTSEKQIEVPFFEDARAKTAPYYSTERDIKSVQKEIAGIMDQLGGERIRFVEGWFGEKPRRYGTILKFRYADQDAQIVSAGLPMRSATGKKIQTVKVQALLIVRDQLKAAFTALVFSPGSYPLMQYVLGDGDKTLGEMFVNRYELPMLNPPAEEIRIEKAE